VHAPIVRALRQRARRAMRLWLFACNRLHLRRVNRDVR
jgi:hypothetical protein